MPDRSLDEGNDEALDGVCDGAGQFPKDPVQGAKACQVWKSKVWQVLSVKAPVQWAKDCQVLKSKAACQDFWNLFAPEL